MSNRAFIYGAVVIGTLAISLDFASVDLALPALETQYGLDIESVQWVINGYVLAFAVLMVTGGRLADAYGRRKIFLIGMGISRLRRSWAEWHGAGEGDYLSRPARCGCGAIVAG